MDQEEAGAASESEKSQASEDDEEIGRGTPRSDSGSSSFMQSCNEEGLNDNFVLLLDLVTGELGFIVLEELINFVGSTFSLSLRGLRYNDL